MDYQRRCDRCNKATLLPNTPKTCQLYCVMKRESVSKFDSCKSFVYGKFDKNWVK